MMLSARLLNNKSKQNIVHTEPWLLGDTKIEGEGQFNFCFESIISVSMQQHFSILRRNNL